MTNLIERVNELESEFKTAYSLSDSEKAKYKREIQDLAEMLEWIRDEMKSIEKGTCDDEKKKMVFKMKNKTRFSFEQFSFYLWTKDYTKIPIDIYLWRPGEEKEIVIYHDFTRQYNYKRHGNLDLSADSDSIEFKLLERENSAAVAKERKIVKGYSGTHGLMMRLRNFRTDVADFDLKAKTRKIEKLAIAILDKTEKEPELAYKTSKLTKVYLPTLCRTMENYLEVKPIFCVYGLRIGIYKTKDKQIVFYFGGSSIGQMVFTKIKGKHLIP